LRPPDLVFLPTVDCNSDAGIECTGDWPSQCAPACTGGDCCSPRLGQFQCVPRDANGHCPAPDIFVDTARIDGLYTFEWRYFPADDCAIVEACVNASGWRRLLKFD